MRSKSKTRGIRFSEQENLLIDAKLKETGVSFAAFARRLILDHLMSEGEATNSSLVNDLMMQSEPNALRPATQIKQLRTTFHIQLLLAEVLSTVLGDRKKALAIYTRIAEKIDKQTRESGYVTNVDDEMGET